VTDGQLCPACETTFYAEECEVCAREEHDKLRAAYERLREAAAAAEHELQDASQTLPVRQARLSLRKALASHEASGTAAPSKSSDHECTDRNIEAINRLIHGGVGGACLSMDQDHALRLAIELIKEQGK
jgi:hypothetical protein